MRIVAYESPAPLRDYERWIAWLTEEQFIIGLDHKRTGDTKTVFLPVYFFGRAREVAEDRARAFWADEKAKKEAKIARAKVQAEKNRKPEVSP